MEYKVALQSAPDGSQRAQSKSEYPASEYKEQFIKNKDLILFFIMHQTLDEPVLEFVITGDISNDMVLICYTYRAKKRYTCIQVISRLIARRK